MNKKGNTNMSTSYVPAKDDGVDHVRITIKLDRDGDDEKSILKMWRESLIIYRFIYKFNEMLKAKFQRGNMGVMRLEPTISDRFNSTNKVYPRKLFGDPIHLNLEKFTKHYKLNYDIGDINPVIAQLIMDSYTQYCTSKKVLYIRIDCD